MFQRIRKNRGWQTVIAILLALAIIVGLSSLSGSDVKKVADDGVNWWQSTFSSEQNRWEQRFDQVQESQP